jgi:hypothetical protein
MLRRVFISLAVIAALSASDLQAAKPRKPRKPGKPASKLVRVPQDAKNLTVAIKSVADGGVIEMAAGTYASPNAGFSINNPRKGFTVRAAAGAAVAIDGGGSRQLLRYTNSDRARGKLVTFERITFQNGFSAKSGTSGGVTLSKSEALFRNCSFVNNRAAAPATGGGAVKVLDGSSATFVSSSFRGNSSQLRGGALAVRNSTATLQGGEMVGNRTNLPGHHPNSHGGAILVIDGILRVTGVRFENNQAGWVGGAIYSIGNWDKGSDVLVTGASFIANQAVSDPCCDNPFATSGGALHAEDLVTLRVQKSLFLRNRADMGGAVDGYRSIVDIGGSVFQGNQTTSVKPAGGAGGAIAMLSTDFSDASTGFGAVNRPAARLTVAQSLLLGGSEVARAPFNGGCILASGDIQRMYGGGAVPQAGTLADNRARIEIRGTVLADCDVETSTPGGTGVGGGLVGDLIDLVVEDSMVLDSDARGTGAAGGGLALRQESNARIVRTAFARNSAQRSGGALNLNGATVQVDDCRFYSNDVVPGSSESVGESRGAAIFSTPLQDPARLRNVAGVVANSVFSEDLGIPLFETDPASGPINELRYDNNRFNPVLFGELVYVNNLAAPQGASVAELNGLTVSHGALGTTDKSAVPNARFFGPREGVLRAVPSPNSVGAAPSSLSSLLAYAWSGGSASIGAVPLPAKAGLLEVLPGAHTLTVDGAAVATVQAPTSKALSLNGARFSADLTWRDAAGNTGAGHPVRLSGDTGYFAFTSSGRADVIVRIEDGRRVNGHFWVSLGGQTDLEYTLTVTDTVTGMSKSYFKPLGQRASQRDTEAIPAE